MAKIISVALQAVAVDLVSMGQGCADILRNPGVTDIFLSMRQVTGDRKALITTSDKEETKEKANHIHVQHAIQTNTYAAECGYGLPQPSGHQPIDGCNIKLQDVRVVLNVVDFRTANNSRGSEVGLEIVKIYLQYFLKRPVEHNQSCKTDTVKRACQYCI